MEDMTEEQLETLSRTTQGHIDHLYQQLKELRELQVRVSTEQCRRNPSGELELRAGALVRVSDSRTNGELDLWAGGKLAVITEKMKSITQREKQCFSIRVQGTKGTQNSYYAEELTVLSYDQQHLINEWELEDLLLGETDDTDRFNRA